MLISIILSHGPSSFWALDQAPEAREDYAVEVADRVYLHRGEVIARVSGLGDAEEYGIDGHATVIVARVPDHEAGAFIEALAEIVRYFLQDRAIVVEPSDSYNVFAN